jgi:hypothetical protein
MSKRSTDLYEEMQTIFGASFSPTVTPLNESLDEGAKHARGRDMRPQPSGKNAVSKTMRKQSGHPGVPRKPSKRQRERDAKADKKKSSDAKYRKDAEAKGKKGPDDFRKDWDEKHAARSKSKAKPDSKSKDKSGGGGGASGETSSRKSSSGHDPFKNSSNLGKGPGTPKGHTGTGPRKHNATGCWDCTCPGNVYSSGCNCKSSGNGANCPPKGTLKHIKYKSNYKRAYNDLYHAWRGDKDKRASK